MSADVDPEDKTEEPTEKRLHDAVERGEVAFSREAPLFASLSAALIALIFIVPSRAEALLTALAGLIGDPAGWRIRRGEDVLALAAPIVSAAAHFLLPAVALLTAAGVLASAAQSPPRIVPDRILPDASRVSLRKGFRRVFGARGWTEFLKSLVKLAAVIAVAMMMLIGQKAVLLTAMDADPGMLPQRVLDLAVKTIAAVMVATVAVAAADLAWSRILWRRDHRMSKQEVKEELRQAEGDRMVKARLRSLRLDRSRKRMLSAVPRATMVVVNPTHYAVAMRYVRAEGGAPIVVAKGADFIALKIRSIAEEHAIPVIEDKPLARSLHAAVDVDRPIPAEFYRAVAEIVHLIQQRKAQWAQPRH
ncbi:MAG TPA: EscU/YscU/HrcU family type III secretion system export apparatus switch protein [Roseiarcus sp.]|jgi:flagellar biosynthetic protein FlhB|nr:EscU/YscU/HrcU family type III secretion system export apparatus switch protein [Roseiarcus sp.]